MSVLIAIYLHISPQFTQHTKIEYKTLNPTNTQRRANCTYIAVQGLVHERARHLYRISSFTVRGEVNMIIQLQIFASPPAILARPQRMGLW